MRELPSDRTRDESAAYPRRTPRNAALKAGFAVRRDGLLFGTELGVEVGSELRAIGRWG